MELTKEQQIELLSLLEYSLEAIDYWFKDCDVSEDTIKENNDYSDKCTEFINLLKKEQ